MSLLRSQAVLHPKRPSAISSRQSGNLQARLISRSRKPVWNLCLKLSAGTRSRDQQVSAHLNHLVKTKTEGRSESAQLFEEGVSEAEHDQMLQAARGREQGSLII